jgi:AcrR family transcriptional regulator
MAGPRSGARRRGVLSRDKVLRAAVALADEGGAAVVSMRKLAQHLGVEPMSLYHHVSDKEDVLDGMVDVVVDEINARLAAIGGDAAPGWKAALRERILHAREVMLAHPWAPEVILSRTTMSPAVLRYFEELAALLRGGGLPISLIHHTMHALGSRALGFAQELFTPRGGEEQAIDPEAAAAMMERMAADFPNLTEIAVIESGGHDADSTLGWCDDQFEFEFGLDLLLDGIERLHLAAEARLG